MLPAIASLGLGSIGIGTLDLNNLNNVQSSFRLVFSVILIFISNLSVLRAPSVEPLAPWYHGSLVV